MERKLDLEFPNYSRKLSNLRKAETNLRNTSAEVGIRGYIKALRTLNAEMLGRLDVFLAGKSRQSRRRPLKRRMCQGTRPARFILQSRASRICRD
jgi:hypothetical protein